MASITSIVAAIKDDLGAVLGDAFIEQCVRDSGHTWRDRQLDPVTTVQLFIQQILHGNVACREVRHLPEARSDFSGSAYCQARTRLPLASLQTLVRRINDAALPSAEVSDPRWRGHRVRLIDGTSFSMPDTPALQEHFGQPGQQRQGCGFPVAHLLAQFNAHTGMLVDVTASPMRTHDMARVPDLIDHFQADDIALADCAFATYAHFSLLLQRKSHGLFPNHQRRIIDFTPGRDHAQPGRDKHAKQKGLPRSRWIKRLGRDDQQVEWFKPTKRPKWISKDAYDALPDSIMVRELRRRVRRPDGRCVTITLVTTLIDSDRYPAGELVKLLERRWDVETNLRHLKTTMAMDVLRCKTVEGVLKELTVYVLVYNLVRLVMLEAAKRQRVSVGRISFIDALTWTVHARPGDPLPHLVVNRHRRKRLEPRAVKRRPKQYQLLNKPRDQLRKALISKGDTA